MENPINKRPLVSSLFAVTLCASALAAATSDISAETDPIVPLKIAGQNYVSPDGKEVKFWGVNLVSFYPETPEKAEAVARNLRSLGVNLARPHHNLRRSLDWNPDLPSGALVTYENNSRTFEPTALDRFDAMNAALRRNGIYLALSAHFTRSFLPGDADILSTADAADNAAWSAAIEELRRRHWSQAFDEWKLLPVIDERAALLTEEFIKNLLVHKNPYSGRDYAGDPQVLSIEVVNEHSIEYAIICGHKMPAYWQTRLETRWLEHAAAAGVADAVESDLYTPRTDKIIQARSAFLTALDEVYFERIRAAVRSTGCTAPMTFSNLWRGDSTADMHARKADFVEHHAYIDPLVVREIDDGFHLAARSALAGKPYFIGELNQAEGEKNIFVQSPHRTMLPLASAAYGSLHDWSGLVWFAWIHGEESRIGDDGWAVYERRRSNLGGMVADGMMLDHMRTAGMIYRRGLVAASRTPVTLWTDAPFHAGGYNDLMRGKYDYKPGWQDIHAIRRAYGPVPDSQPAAPWMAAAATSPLVSDTGEIVKDVTRKQLTVAAPQTESFSGFLDGKAPTGLKHLSLAAADGSFATVIVVADDEGKPVSEATRLVISRTAIAADGKETDNAPAIRLAGIAAPSGGAKWTFTITRPRSEAGKTLPAPFDATGSLALPEPDWHEAELVLR
ncbi:hypothetical protein OPIT5_19190 [Opitutaceae bacterium TAV5]|nr:hypothetical protein OPIT5_19190 [Opitutaceae bacterium TAV5]